MADSFYVVMFYKPELNSKSAVFKVPLPISAHKSKLSCFMSVCLSCDRIGETSCLSNHNGHKEGATDTTFIKNDSFVVSVVSPLCSWG